MAPEIIGDSNLCVHKQDEAGPRPRPFIYVPPVAVFVPQGRAELRGCHGNQRAHKAKHSYHLAF